METSTKGEATSRRIIEAAYTLFIEQGFHATSMRQIAAQAGLAVAGIYNHYDSKEAIWEAVFVDKHPYRTIMTLLLDSKTATVAEFIKDSAQRLVTELGQHRELINLMFIEIVEFKGVHLPTLYAAVLPQIRQLAQIFANKSGTLRQVPYPVLARSFAGLFFSFYITELMMPEPARLAMGPNSLDVFVDIYLYGILKESTERDHD